MENWKSELRASYRKASEIASKFDLNLEELKKITKHFRAQITQYYANLIKEKGDPFYLQVIPDLAELNDLHGELDPLKEDRDSPVPCIVHRYPDRVLFLVSPSCASFCRFCTRKRRVGNPKKIDLREIEEGFTYIRLHREVRDVIVSGGDPLILSDRRLEYILKRLREIPHVEIIRIGTRVPCFLPNRVTPELVQILRKYHPLYINVHFNHPEEITDLASQALTLLADGGIPLGNQTVLLKGVNDNPEIMRRLVQKLLKVRVRPYYIYQADYVQGTEHLRTSVRKGIEIMSALRGWTSGLAVPYFVIDAPGGGGKIPILPEYVVSMTDEEVVLRNYKEEIFVYHQAKNGEESFPRGDNPCFLSPQQMRV